MESEFPPELRNGQIQAYIDGTADAQTQALIEAYLTDDPAFAESLRQFAWLNDKLAKTLHHVTSPSSLELGEYLLGLLTEERACAITQDIQSYPHLARAVDTLQSFLDASDVSPSHVSFGQAPLPTRLAYQVQVIIARVVEGLDAVFVAGVSPALAGIRGEPSLRGQRQERLAFEAGDAQIILEVQQDPAQQAHRMILGLVIGVDAPDTFEAFLYSAGDLLQSVPVNDIGNFVITGVVPNLYDLILGPADGSSEIHIQEIRVQ